jgi:glycine cleavage system aminomethyltransferase T
MNYLTQWGGLAKIGMRLRGSMGPEIQVRYRNPVELGWGHLVKFDHDFIGRAVLEREVTNPRRKMVTLVWNAEDILDVLASQFRTGVPYPPMDNPNHFGFEVGDKTHSLTLYADRVLKDGKLVGISSGQAYTYYYRQMLSLCSIDVPYGDVGTEVVVLWGDPGTRQKEIRATVSRFPYLDENRNEHVDVNKIPCAVVRRSAT